MAIRLRVALALMLVVCLTFGPTQVTAALKKHFCFSMCSELWDNYLGDTGACNNPNGANCVGGLPAAMAYVRGMQNNGEPTMMLWDIDHVSAFVQMHPDNWNVNMRFLKNYGLGTFVAEPSVFQSPGTVFTLLRDPQVKVLTTNANIPLDNPWFAFRFSSYVDPSTGIAVLNLAYTWYSGSFPDWQGALYQQLDILHKRSDVKHVVVFDFDSQAYGVGNCSGLVQGLQSFTPMKIDAVYCLSGGAPTTFSVINGTYAFLVDGNTAGLYGLTANDLACIDFTLDPSASYITAANYSLYNLDTLPSALKTPLYYSDIAFTQAIADQATTNNPTVGYTSAMPASITGHCSGGECASGDMWTDAFRWKMGVDIAWWNSGGIRGPGWPAGPVKMADLFASMPYADTMCTATMLGATVWDMFNYSMSANPVVSTLTPRGYYMLIFSGARVTWSPDLTASPTKLLSIDILNRTTSIWEPLVRTRLYKVVMTEFECGFMPPESTFVQRAAYAGEVGPTYYNTLTVHRVVAEYLTAKTTASNPLQIGLDGRLTPISGALESQALNWAQSPSTCAAGTYWVSSLGTCMPCPAGLTSSYGTNICVTPTSSNTVLIAVLVSVFGVLLCVAAAAAVVASRKSGGRDVANAPKSGRVTLLFTDIESSTNLWSTVPVSMNVSLEKHHEIIRSVIVKHKAYEVKTVGDSFMIACSSEAAAVAVSMDIQRNMQAASWPPSIHDAYAAIALGTEEALDGVIDNPTGTAVTDPAFNGLRVRIGIHCGEPTVVFDEITKGYDYYGPMVNVAARIESVAHGGQVCVSGEVLSKAGGLDGIATRLLGKAALKGVSDPVEVHELLPAELKYKRTFTQKDQFEEKDDGVEGRGGDTGSVGSSTSTATGNNGEIDTISQYNSLFFKNLVKVMKPADVKTLRTIMLRSWHIEDSSNAAAAGVKAKDAPIERLCRRIALGVAKDMKNLQKNAGGASTAPTTENV